MPPRIEHIGIAPDDLERPGHPGQLLVPGPGMRTSRNRFLSLH